jgi:hypothetical protein
MIAIKLLGPKAAAGNSFANGSNVQLATNVLCVHTGGTAGLVTVCNSAGDGPGTFVLGAAGSGDCMIVIKKNSTDVMYSNQGSVEFTPCLTEN